MNTKYTDQVAAKAAARDARYDKAWPLAGYEPGYLSRICGTCDVQFVGHRTATNCLECAVAAVKERAWEPEEPGYVQYRDETVDRILKLSANFGEFGAVAADVIRMMRVEHRRLNWQSIRFGARVLETEDALRAAREWINERDDIGGHSEHGLALLTKIDKALASAMDGFKFMLGDRIRKVKGYAFPGVIVAAFRTLAGKERYVAECTAEAVAGMLHVYNADQLEGIANDG